MLPPRPWTRTRASSLSGTPRRRPVIRTGPTWGSSTVVSQAQDSGQPMGRTAWRRRGAIVHRWPVRKPRAIYEMLPSGAMRGKSDRDLLEVIDDAIAEAVRRAGDRLACRPGCTGCCHGPFPINGLDAARLRQGLAELAVRAPERAAALVERARA